MAQKAETNFRKKVRADLQSLVMVGLPFFFEPIQQKAIKGSPDFFLCVDGFFIALELKSTGGNLSKVPAEKLKRVAHANGLGIMADPQGWPMAFEAIKKLFKTQKMETMQ